MTIHYQNGNGEEKFISDVIHLQNVDDCIFIASMKNGAELTLLVERIEGIYYQDKEQQAIQRENERLKGIIAMTEQHFNPPLPFADEFDNEIKKAKKQAVLEFAHKLESVAVQEGECEDYVCCIVERLLREYKNEQSE